MIKEENTITIHFQKGEGRYVVKSISVISPRKNDQQQKNLQYKSFQQSNVEKMNSTQRTSFHTMDF